MKRKPKEDQIELRRWCIEQAVRWPQVGSVGGMMGGGGGYVDADLIGRAEKILAWITNA